MSADGEPEYGQKNGFSEDTCTCTGGLANQNQNTPKEIEHKIRITGAPPAPAQEGLQLGRSKKNNDNPMGNFG